MLIPGEPVGAGRFQARRGCIASSRLTRRVRRRGGDCPCSPQAVLRVRRRAGNAAARPGRRGWRGWCGSLSGVARMCWILPGRTARPQAVLARPRWRWSFPLAQLDCRRAEVAAPLICMRAGDSPGGELARLVPGCAAHPRWSRVVQRIPGGAARLQAWRECGGSSWAPRLVRRRVSCRTCALAAAPSGIAGRPRRRSVRLLAKWRAILFCR